jgi:GNAT superfamily N-acetyltransferase
VNPAQLGRPAPIDADDDTSGFACRHDALTQWLQRRALANAVSGASRTYVVCAEGRRVVGYYALAAGSVALVSAPSRMRRNMPDPLPVIVLGRLAVHADWSGRGIGSGLLKDAVRRALQAAELIGACALLCHAIDDEAKAFYVKHGFTASPLHPLTVMLGLATQTSAFGR